MSRQSLSMPTAGVPITPAGGGHFATVALMLN